MTDEMDQNLDQSEIEKLLQQGSGGGNDPAGDAAAAESPGSDTSESASGDMSENLGQDEVEKLLQQASGGRQGPEADSRAATEAPPPQAASDAATQTATTLSSGAVEGQTDADVQLLIDQAEEALRSVDQPRDNEIPGLAPFQLKPFTGTPANVDQASLDLLRDVELEMRIELGRTHMHLEDVLQLRKGSVVPLDKMAGDPVDVYVNGRLVARGEVLVLNENFCVRIAELISGEEIEHRESA
ncbi:MAG: flagellar motor switch protein FliN [Planctomycetota bacterium]